MATQKLFYSATRIDGKSGISRTETQDTEYGKADKQVSAYILSCLKDGEYLIQSEALDYLNNPIWGITSDGKLTSGNQKFHELIPVLPPAVPQYLSGNYDYPWHEFDPNDQSTWPTGNPDNGRGWECEDTEHPGRYYQNLFVDSCPFWGMLKIYRYRKQKTMPVIVIDNPEYPAVEAERSKKYDELVKFVKSALFPVGKYQFFMLPVETKEGYNPYKWKVDDVPMVPTYDFPFSSANGGYTLLYRPLRQPEMITIKWRDSKTGQSGTTVKDAFIEAYEAGCTSIKDLIAPSTIPDARTRRLLGIV